MVPFVIVDCTCSQWQRNRKVSRVPIPLRRATVYPLFAKEEPQTVFLFNSC